MDKLRNTAKGGWHPAGKDGGKESWRGDFKGIGQVAGWVGKGKSSGSGDSAQNHQSRPLASLKDPDAFGPPPKNVRYHGGAVVPDAITPDRSGLGVVGRLKDEGRLVRNGGSEEPEAGSDTQTPEQPPVPFKADRTGLSTSSLPKPPVHQAVKEMTTSSLGAGGSKPKPSLPPRFPPRQGSAFPQGVVRAEPPSYEAAVQQDPAPSEILNQGALKRLGAAGVSVPSLGIGGQSYSNNPWQDEPSTSTGTPTSPVQSPGRMSELQSRFAKVSPVTTPPDSPAQGTTFAEKQAAFKTARAFRTDPGSVSLADGKNAASTVNNFRQRHGEQVASGWQSASGLNKKYGISNRISNLAPESSGASAPSVPSPPVSPAVDGFQPAPVRKGPAPLPPPKRIVGLSSTASQPPPVPLATKPRPNCLMGLLLASCFLLLAL